MYRPICPKTSVIKHSKYKRKYSNLWHYFVAIIINVLLIANCFFRDIRARSKHLNDDPLEECNELVLELVAILANRLSVFIAKNEMIGCVNSS